MEERGIANYNSRENQTWWLDDRASLSSLLRCPKGTQLDPWRCWVTPSIEIGSTKPILLLVKKHKLSKRNSWSVGGLG